MSSVPHFAKKMWPLFCVLIANGFGSFSALRWAKNELCATLWLKVMAFFVSWLPINLAHSRLRDGPRMNSVQHFGKKLWPLFRVLIANGLCFVTGQEWASSDSLAKICGLSFVSWLTMDSAWSLLRNKPRMRSVWCTSKKLWPLFLCFDCQRMRSSINSLKKNCIQNNA